MTSHRRSSSFSDPGSGGEENAEREAARNCKWNSKFELRLQSPLLWRVRNFIRKFELFPPEFMKRNHHKEVIGDVSDRKQQETTVLWTISKVEFLIFFEPQIGNQFLVPLTCSVGGSIRAGRAARTRQEAPSSGVRCWKGRGGPEEDCLRTTEPKNEKRIEILKIRKNSFPLQKKITFIKITYKIP